MGTSEMCRITRNLDLKPDPRVLDLNGESCCARLRECIMLLQFGNVVWTRERSRIVGLVIENQTLASSGGRMKEKCSLSINEERIR